MSNHESLFAVVERPKRGRKATAMEIEPAEVQRVAQFHSFVQSNGQALFKTRAGVEHFDRQDALNVAARVKAVAKRNDIALDCKAEPTGRDDAGNVQYGVRGWIPTPRKARAASASL